MLNYILIAVTAFSIGFGLGGIFGETTASYKYQSQANERGYARYNPINAVWQWNEPSTNR